MGENDTEIGPVNDLLSIPPSRRIAQARGSVPTWLMPQMQLPIFNQGIHLITPNLGYQRDGDDIVYLHGMMPVFLHHCDDIASFKMIVSQFYINGNAKQAELVRVFGIQPLALKRWVKRYRASGPKAFFETRRKRRATPKKSP